jgi:hypothetical protein
MATLKEARVARICLAQHVKTGKNIPNDYVQKIPNEHKKSHRT